MINSTSYPNKVNLENCAKEPIHIIGKIQSHGTLLVCDPRNFKILQAANNTVEYFNISTEELLGNKLSLLLQEEEVSRLRTALSERDFEEPRQVKVNGKKFLILPHLSEGNLVLDFEPLVEVNDPFFWQKQLTTVLNRFEKAGTAEELCLAAVETARKIFGYHRAMVYRFDEDWNGEVIAESKEEDMEPWVGLRYPATDIPEQSRNLFLKHRVRVITNVNYTPVPIVPEISPLTGEPLDISGSGLRAVSPIHIEYLQNMRVGASLTAAIVLKGKLWGLIACHHKTDKYLDFHQRENCRFLAHILSGELALIESTGEISRSKYLEDKRRQLVVQMENNKDLLYALNKDKVNFTDLFNCAGGAIFMNDKWALSGNTPSLDQLESLLANFVKKQPNSIIVTKNLSLIFPEAEAYKSTASGLLSLRISKRKYIFWFKPEAVQVVNWGGNPHNKAFYNEKHKRLSPRKSFDKWSEKLLGMSEAWDDQDWKVARSFKEDISHVVLNQQREEILELNRQLVQANEELKLFSYGLSHDLRAPIRGMEGFLTILEEDFGEELSEGGIKMLQMTRGLTFKMNNLIDDILEYSRVNQTGKVELKEINTGEIIEEVLELFNVKQSYPKTKVRLQPQMPVMYGDRRMLFQVWANLINNALKYSAERDQPKIEIGVTSGESGDIFFVKDNGIGINPDYKEKIFETFRRAVGSRFQGTGIGLAIVKKIIEKHNGEVWVESIPDEGSQFYFYLASEKEKK